MFTFTLIFIFTLSLIFIFIYMFTFKKLKIILFSITQILFYEKFDKSIRRVAKFCW